MSAKIRLSGSRENGLLENQPWSSHYLPSLPQALAPLTLIRGPLGSGKTAMLDGWCARLPDSYPVLRVTAVGLAESRDLWARLVTAGDSAGMMMIPADDPAPTDPTTHYLQLEDWLLTLRVQTVIIIEAYELVTSAPLDCQLAELLQLSRRLNFIVAARRYSILDTPVITSRFPTTQIVLSGLPIAPLPRPRPDLPASDDFTVFGDPTLLLDQHARRFLATIAFFDGVSARFLTSALGITCGEAAARLAQLQGYGLVEERWDLETTVYVCSHRLLPTLRNLAETLWGEAGVTTLRRLYAATIVGSHTPEALAILIDHGDLAGACDIVQAYFGQFLAQGSRVIEILRNIPAHDVDPYPTLLGLLLMLEDLSPSTAHETVDDLARKIQGIPEPDPAEESRGGFMTDLAVRATAAGILGNWDRSLKIARHMELALGEWDRDFYPGASATLPWMYAVASRISVLTGQIGMAARTAMRSWDTAKACGAPNAEVCALSQLALVRSITRDISASDGYLDEAEAIIDSVHSTFPPRSQHYRDLARALNAYYREQPERALSLLGRVCEQVDHSAMWPLVVLAESLVIQSMSGAHAALLRFRTRLSNLRGDLRLSPELLAAIVSRMADLAMYSNDLNSAQFLLDNGTKQTVSILMSKARLDLLRGDLRACLTTAQRAQQGPAVPWSAPQLSLLLAVARFHMGDHDQAFADLDEAAPAICGIGGFSILATIPYDALLAIALAARDSDRIDIVGVVTGLDSRHRMQLFDRLTPAETRILAAVQECTTVTRAADALCISMNTVKFHLKNIYQKLGVSDRQEALNRAIYLGLLPPSSRSDPALVGQMPGGRPR